jgi:hypothetical protein
VADIPHLHPGTRQRRRLDREAFQRLDESPLELLLIRGLYTAGIGMILAALFL